MGSMRKTVEDEYTIFPNSTPSFGNYTATESIESEGRSPGTDPFVESDNATFGFVNETVDNTSPTVSGNCEAGPASFVAVLQQQPSTSAAANKINDTLSTILETLSPLPHGDKMVLKRKLVEYFEQDEAQQKLIRLTLSDIQ